MCDQQLTVEIPRDCERYRLQPPTIIDYYAGAPYWQKGNLSKNKNILFYNLS